MAQSHIKISDFPKAVDLCNFADKLWLDFMNSDAGLAHYPAFIFKATLKAKKAKRPPYILVRMPFKSATGDINLWEEMTSNKDPEMAMQFAKAHSKKLEEL